MFVVYGGRDQFNLDAQIESFLYVACQRGLTVKAVVRPQGQARPQHGPQFRARRHRLAGAAVGPLQPAPGGLRPLTARTPARVRRQSPLLAPWSR